MRYRICDEFSERFQQVGEYVRTENLMNSLNMYVLRFSNSEEERFLAYQIIETHIMKSEKYVLTENNWLYDKDSYNKRNIPFSIRDSLFSPIQLNEDDAETVRILMRNKKEFKISQFFVKDHYRTGLEV